MSTAVVRPRLVTRRFAGVGLAALAYFFAEGMLVPAVPRYVEGPLAGSDAAVGLVVGAFSVSALVLRPWAGRLADRRGRARLMIIGASVYGVSVAAYSVAGSVSVLLALRVLTGVGEAFFFVGALTAMSDLAPAERRGEAMSLFSLSLYAGIALGPPVAEAVAGSFGFTAVWLVATAAAATAVVLTKRVGETGDGPATVAPRQARLIHPAAVLVAVRSLGARLPDQLGARRSVRFALAGIAAGLAVIGGWRTVPGLVAGTALLAVGVALATPAIFALALDGVPPTERGAVMSVVSMSLDIAFGLGPAAFGLLAATTGRPTAFLLTALIPLTGLALLTASARSPYPRPA